MLDHDVTEMRMCLSLGREGWMEGVNDVKGGFFQWLKTFQRWPTSIIATLIRGYLKNFFFKNKQWTIFLNQFSPSQFCQFPLTGVNEKPTYYMHLLRCEAGHHHFFITFCSCNAIDQLNVHWSKASSRPSWPTNEQDLWWSSGHGWNCNLPTTLQTHKQDMNLTFQLFQIGTSALMADTESKKHYLMFTLVLKTSHLIIIVWQNGLHRTDCKSSTIPHLCPCPR